MNQQQAARKAFPVLARDPDIPTVLRQTKASGDSNEKHRNRSKSKNKIPKSIRYDLENALVSLCDVWFEEIKPYLVRNNIKVHAHEVSEERCEDAAAGDGDCSHLDPGASPDHRRHRSVSCAGYCSTQPTASKAPCRKPRTPLAPLQEPGPCPSTQIPCQNRKTASEPKPRKQRLRQRTFETHPLSQQNFVPRLCRTYSILPHNMTLENSVQKNCGNKTAIKTNNAHILEKYYIPRVKSKRKNKKIQTEKLPGIEFKTKAHVKPCLKSFERCNGTTSFFPDENNKNKTQCELHDLSPLFKKDLIDIIADKNEKRLQLLYKSPVSEYYPSAMNLLPSPITKRKSSPPKKPWR